MGRVDFIIYGRFIELARTKIIELPPDDAQVSELSYFDALVSELSYFDALVEMGVEKDAGNDETETPSDS